MHALARMMTGALALVAGAASAQRLEAQKCEINETSPFQLNSAKIYLSKVSGGKQDEKLKHIRNAVQVLTDNPDKIGNQLGRNWMLGRALAAFIQETPGQSFIQTRSNVGYTSDPNGKINVLLAADTAFSQVVQLNPACATYADLATARRGIFNRLYKGAYDEYKAQRLDSAQALVRLALMVNPRSPEAYNLLGGIMQQQNNEAGMLEAFSKVAELSGSDTAYAQIKGPAMSNVAIIKLNMAERATGAEKQALLASSRDYFREYLKLNSSDAQAQAGLSRVLTLLGDTAAVVAIASDMLAHPEKYSDIQLFEAASNAALAKRYAESAKLFESGLAQNPYYRDALFNLATTYTEIGDYDKAAATARRLVEVDPNNPDNWKVLARVFQLRAKATKEPKLTKALTDTLILYVARADSMKTRVSFTQFSHKGAQHALSGQVENTGTVPATLNLKFEFLDKTGKVIGAKSVTVGPIAPKSSSPFRVEVVQTGIVAFRYANAGATK